MFIQMLPAIKGPVTSKLFTLITSITILSCNSVPTEKTPTTDMTSQDYVAILTEKEISSANNIADNLGDLITTISFAVATDNKKDFEDGVIPWANIENPEKDIPQLIDKDKIIISESEVTIIIDYPLTNEYRFKLQSPNGFTRENLLKEISKNYYKIYEEEEKSAAIKTLPMNQRKIYNRNQTDGKFGIWGHDIADLDLSEILVYKNTDGQIILSLNIES